jgi:pyruvate dehydrogenase E2 component (dihydrolipoamide acetyltransferase)
MKQHGLYEFRFPDIGEGIHEGRVLEWMRHPGDRVSQGEVLALVETDKVVAEMPSPKDGVLRELAVEEGEEIQVGQVLARLELSGADSMRDEQRPRGETGSSAGPMGSSGSSASSAGDGGAVVGRLEAGSGTVLPPSREAGTARARSEQGGAAGDGRSARRVPATPVARRLAARLGVELSAVEGSGPAGRVLKDDILAAAKVLAVDRPAGGRVPDTEPALAAASERQRLDGAWAVDPSSPEGSPGIHRLSTLRRTLARNMEKSWQIPAAVVHELTEVDELASLREKLNGEAKAAGGGHLSFLPFFIKVAALSLKRFPRLNSWYHPEQEAFETPRSINVGFALDSEEGLLAPVIHDADALTLEEIQSQIDRLREAASNRRIELSDLRDGTFTLTNYGSIGGLHGRPLILPPQVAILGFGRIHEAPVVREGDVVPARLLPLSLVFDHRLIDGAYAAGFIRLFMSLLSAPHRLLALMR